MATVLVGSIEVPCACIGIRLSPCYFIVSISIRFALEVEIDIEFLGSISRTISVGLEVKGVSFISLGLSVQIVSRESGSVESIFASEIRWFCSI